MTSQDTTVIEYDFEFFVSHNYQNFTDIRATLVSRISRDQDDFTQRDNSVFDFVKNKVNEKIIKKQGVKYYFLYAYERDGSYELGFSLLILFNAAVNYGSIRQSIDYLNEDFTKTFKSLLGEEYSIESRLNEEEIVQKKKGEAFRLEGLWKNITAGQIWSFLGIWFLLAVVYGMAKQGENSSKPQSTDGYIDQVVEKKLNEAIYRKKVDFIIDNFPLIRDTIFINK